MVHKSAVRVVLRSRPADGPGHINYLADKKTVAITQTKVFEGRPGATAPPQTYQFKFDNILANATQDEVYEVCGADIVRRALEGFNGTIMAYGQTGAGKTYTMSGGRSSYKQRGIIPRAVSHLFAELKAMPDVQPRVTVQYLEIYNEALYDLLDITTQPHEINIYESSKGVVTVGGLRKAEVASEAEALALLFEGETNRVIGEHQLNRESSRSHSIFIVNLELRPAGESGGGGGDVLVSKLALVDLAGSERVSKTKSEGLVLREAGHINKSLSILEQVILGLGEKNREHVPFRSSKLTHVLKNSLGGNCHTVLVANVWSEAGQADETISTFRFAQRMMRVTCEISANVVQDSSARVRQLERQVGELQQELAMHDAMGARSGMQYMPYSDAQRADLSRRVVDFLAAEPAYDSIEPLELNSLRHMREVLYACRKLYHSRGGGGGVWPSAAAGSFPAAAARAAPVSSSAAAAVPRQSTDPGHSTGAAVPGPGSPQPQPPPRPGGGAEGVGEVDGAEQAGGAGVAPDDARPSADDDGGGAAMLERLMSAQGSGPSGGSRGAGGAGSGPPPPEQRQALEDYKAGPGRVKASLLADNRAKLKASRKRAKELGLAVNAAKRELDSLKPREEQLKQQRGAQQGDGAQVLDAEEYDTLMRIKELKGQYREHYNELLVVKSEIDYTQGLVEQCGKELVLEFNAWYMDTYGVAAGLQDDSLAALDDDGPMPAAPPPARTGGKAALPPHPGPVSGLSPVATGSVVANVTPAGPRSAGCLTVPDSPSGASVSSAASFPSGAGRAGGAHGSGGSVTSKAKSKPLHLASLVPQPTGDELGSTEAMAYYNAQQVLISKTVGVAHRPGSSKKVRAQPAFGGGAARPDMSTKQLVPDIQTAMHPTRKQ